MTVMERYGAVGHRAYDLVRRFQYLPGWSFEVHGDPEGVRLDITFAVPDADGPGTSQTQCVRTLVPPFRADGDFYNWLRWRLERIALHEVREFFQVDGVKVFDPHALPDR
jgi:hypothetical protein